MWKEAAKIIVIRSRKSESSIICSWAWVPEDTSTQPTSEFIKCKYWMYRKIKITVFFMWLAFWSSDISSFYCSGINLFLVDYTCCKLCNIWLLLFRNNSRSYHYTGASHWRKNIITDITQDKVIDNTLKR